MASSETRRPTPNQLKLMRAIRDGHVRDVWHLRAGHAIRRADVRSSGRGGAQGQKVTAAVTELHRLGWAEADGEARDERPWRLTEQGETFLQKEAS